MGESELLKGLRKAREHVEYDKCCSCVAFIPLRDTQPGRVKGCCGFNPRESENFGARVCYNDDWCMQHIPLKGDGSE